MLRLVWDAEMSAGELADRTGMTKPAASQHLKLLLDADLMQVRTEVHRRMYRVNLPRVREVQQFLDAFWDDTLSQLQHTAEARHRPAQH